eukprot:s1944_g1.t1
MSLWISVLVRAHRGASILAQMRHGWKRAWPGLAIAPWMLIPAYGNPVCSVTGQAYRDAAPPVQGLPNGAFMVDASACQALCASNPTCHHFTWYTNNHGCWLGQEAEGLVGAPQAVSGPKQCAPPTTAQAVEGPPATSLGPLVVKVPTLTLAPLPSDPAQDEPTESSQSGVLGWLVAACLVGLLLVVGFLGQRYFCRPSKPKESARKRHMRRTQGMAPAEPEDEDEEADVEKPMMPWEQRAQASRPVSSSGFQASAADGFVRLPLEDATMQVPTQDSGLRALLSDR